MPKIVEFAPPWLGRPSPAATFLAHTDSEGKHQLRPSLPDDDAYEGPRRTIARRGTEVFAVVNNQLRWADLTMLKDQWQHEVKEQRKNDDERVGRAPERKEEEVVEDGPPYRVLNPNVYGEITQLAVSPDGVFLAIVTRHTIHISLLPDHSHLSSKDPTPIKLKTFQLGPTSHVRPASPVISALWHPLAVYDDHGGCIVTVTQDAVVRLWEINKNDHWSFDKPTIAMDLKKLADATTDDQDFTPLSFGQSKGFSADSIDMEVASACFGGSGYGEEDPWSPLTLWIAMRPGDVYALCPLLPSKWQVPSTFISSLTEDVIARLTEFETRYDAEEEEKPYLRQFSWLAELDAQDPFDLPDACQWRIGVEVRSRPSGFNPIPRLQGPFQFDATNIEELDVTDILVIPARSNLEDYLELGDEDADAAEEGPPVTIVALATRSGTVHTCLELDGVGAQWLSKATGSSFAAPSYEPVSLLLFESLETVRPNDRRPFAWPVFSQDVQSRYSFFVTSAASVAYVSLTSWAEKVGEEFKDPSAAGVGFRIRVATEGIAAARDLIVVSTEPGFKCENANDHLPASVVIYNYDLGYLLLTHSPARIHAVILDSPSFVPDLPQPDSLDEQQPSGPIAVPHRSPYQPPAIFYADSPLQDFVEKHVNHGHRHILEKEIVLSPALLDVMAAAHRLLSYHTQSLERAASSLFLRCERLANEMRDQLSQLTNISDRIIGVNEQIGARFDQSGEAVQVGGGEDESLTARAARAKERQQQLQDRYENIRNNVLKAGGRPLSLKEKNWVAEVNSMSQSLGLSEDSSKPKQVLDRVENATSRSQDLIKEAKRLSRLQAQQADKPVHAPAPQIAEEADGIPPEVRRAKVAEALEMIDRQSDVIDVIRARINHLPNADMITLMWFGDEHVR